MKRNEKPSSQTNLRSQRDINIELGKLRRTHLYFEWMFFPLFLFLSFLFLYLNHVVMKSCLFCWSTSHFNFQLLFHNFLTVLLLFTLISWDKKALPRFDYVFRPSTKKHKELPLWIFLQGLPWAKFFKGIFSRLNHKRQY